MKRLFEENLKQPQAIIFDLDGVITDTAEYHYLAWKRLAEELSIPFSRNFNEELKGISRMESLEKILVHGGRKPDFNEEEKIKLADKKNSIYRRLIQKITPADIFPGIQLLISKIKQHSIKLGLASASKNAFTVMEALKLNKEFDVIIDSKNIKKGKPDPEIFLAAAKLLNVEPTASIGIEDAAAGVEAIKRAGMYAVGIGEKETLANADIVYQNTTELKFEKIITDYQRFFNIAKLDNDTNLAHKNMLTQHNAEVDK